MDIVEYPEQGCATFSINDGGMYGVILNDGNYEEIADALIGDFEVNVCDSTGYLQIFSPDAWYAEHARIYAMTNTQSEYVLSGEWVVNKRNGELFPLHDLQVRKLCDTIGNDWDGMGIDYVSGEFLRNCCERIDFPELGEDGIILFYRLGD